MRTASLILKAISYPIGLFCILYGAIGTFGMPPGGHFSDKTVQGIAFLMVFVGISYFIPNKVITSYTEILAPVLFLFCSPLICVLITSFITISKQGYFSYTSQDGHWIAMLVLFLSSFAPSSLLLHHLSNRADVQSKNSSKPDINDR